MTAEDRPYAGERITYAFVETALGCALLAAGARGVAALLIGDDRARLLADLRLTLADAELAAGDEEMKPLAVAAARLIDDPARPVDFPLDPRGSTIEGAVWKALADLGSGETISYGALAKRLPIPVTAQEVGSACAANRIAVAIPCHRVVKADGSISGYRWGVRRKRRLLQLEAAA